MSLLLRMISANSYTSIRKRDQRFHKQTKMAQ